MRKIAYVCMLVCLNGSIANSVCAEDHTLRKRPEPSAHVSAKPLEESGAIRQALELLLPDKISREELQARQQQLIKRGKPTAENLEAWSNAITYGNAWQRQAGLMVMVTYRPVPYWYAQALADGLTHRSAEERKLARRLVRQLGDGLLDHVRRGLLPRAEQAEQELSQVLLRSSRVLVGEAREELMSWITSVDKTQRISALPLLAQVDKPDLAMWNLVKQELHSTTPGAASSALQVLGAWVPLPAETLDSVIETLTKSDAHIHVLACAILLNSQPLPTESLARLVSMHTEGSDGLRAALWDLFTKMERVSLHAHIDSLVSTCAADIDKPNLELSQAALRFAQIYPEAVTQHQDMVFDQLQLSLQHPVQAQRSILLLRSLSDEMGERSEVVHLVRILAQSTDRSFAIRRTALTRLLAWDPDDEKSQALIRLSLADADWRLVKAAVNNFAKRETWGEKDERAVRQALLNAPNRDVFCELAILTARLPGDVSPVVRRIAGLLRYPTTQGRLLSALEALGPRAEPALTELGLLADAQDANSERARVIYESVSADE